MNSEVRAHITPAFWKWARERVGLTLKEAARKSEISLEQLTRYEQPTGSEEDNPLLNHVKELAKVYGLNPLAMYSDVPFEDEPLPQDFRTLPFDREKKGISYEIHLELNAARERRALALELLDELDEEVPAFSLVGQQREGSKVLAARTEDALGTEHAEKYVDLKQKVEALGVLVFEFHGIPVRELRGYALYYSELPIIGINRIDYVRAKSFTLIHELTHLMLHQQALSNIPFEGNTPEIERFCNDVAGKTLISDERISRINLPPKGFPYDFVKKIAAEHHVSVPVVLIRLRMSGRMDAQHAQHLYQVHTELLGTQSSPKEKPVDSETQNTSEIQNVPETSARESNSRPTGSGKINRLLQELGIPLISWAFENYYEHKLSTVGLSRVLHSLPIHQIAQLEKKIWS